MTAVLLACGPPRPDMRPRSASLTEEAAKSPTPEVARPVTSPAPEVCAALEIVVEAPRDAAVFVDSPTLPLARREVAAGAVLRETIAPAPVGVHIIAVRDADGAAAIADDLPFVVLANERHRWHVKGAPRHRVERCEPGGERTLLQPEDAEVATSGWGPPLVSADGATIARLATYTRSGELAVDLALVDPSRGFRREPLLATTARALAVDAGRFAAASEQILAHGFRRLGADEALPAFEVAAAGGQARARWGDRAGAAELPALPRVHRRGCCKWVASDGLAWGADPAAVVVELALDCENLKAACREEQTHDAPYSRALLAVPLTGEAARKPRHRQLRDDALDRLPGALGEKEQLAYMLYVGPFGPTPDGVLVLRTDDVGRLGGFLHTTAEGRTRRVPLPQVPWVMHQVEAVLFEDADGDGADEAVVLVTAMAGAGPTAAEEFSAAHVFKWDGREIVTLAEAEARIGGRSNVIAVRRALARR